MGYYEFPHTRNYDTDLGYLIKRYFELNTDFESLEKNFNDLKEWCIAQLNSEALKTLIANKLDEWLLDGTLASLINDPLLHITTYDTVVEMISHSGLEIGSKIYCTGADTINDNNGGHFIIRERRSTDVIDNYNLYLVDGSIKVAERILENASGLGNLISFDQAVTSKIFDGTTWTRNNSSITLDTGTIKTDSSLEDIKLNINNENGINFNNNSKNIKVKDCDIDSINSGLRVQFVDTNNNRITDNNITSDKYGILYNDSPSKNNIIAGNNITINGGDGIEINEPTVNAEKFIITNNLINDLQEHSQTAAGFGIGIASLNKSIISENIVDNDILQGLHIEGDSNDLLINANIVSNPKQRGLFDVTKNRNNIFSNNLVVGGTDENFQAGFYDNAFSNTTIKQILAFNNVFKDCKIGISSVRKTNEYLVGDNYFVNCNNAGYIGGYNDKLVTINCESPLVLDKFTYINELQVLGSSIPFTKSSDFIYGKINRLVHAFTQYLDTNYIYLNYANFNNCSIMITDGLTWYNSCKIDNGVLTNESAVGTIIVTYTTENGIGIKCNKPSTCDIILVYDQVTVK